MSRVPVAVRRLCLAQMLTLVLALAACSDAAAPTRGETLHPETTASGASSPVPPPPEAQPLPRYEGGETSLPHVRFTVSVRPRIGKPYISRVDLFMLDWSPARIAFTGRTSDNFETVARKTGKGAVFDDLRSVVKAYPKGLVLGVGLARADPGYPFGLTMIESTIFSPFDFTLQNGNPRYSGILCLTATNQLNLKETADFVDNVGAIRGECRSALQAFPIVVEDTRPAISPSELTATVLRLSRVVIGINRQKRRFLMVFHDPIQLYPIAVLLSGQHSGEVSVSLEGADPKIIKYIEHSRRVLNLPSGDSALAIVDGTQVIGNIARPLPAVLVFPGLR